MQHHEPEKRTLLHLSCFSVHPHSRWLHSHRPQWLPQKSQQRFRSPRLQFWHWEWRLWLESCQDIPTIAGRRIMRWSWRDGIPIQGHLGSKFVQQLKRFTLGGLGRRYSCLPWQGICPCPISYDNTGKAYFPHWRLAEAHSTSLYFSCVVFFQVIYIIMQGAV